MEKIRFGLIGSGWRSEFYIRIAKALPNYFELAAVLTRDKEKQMALAKKFDVKVVGSLDEMQSNNPEFVVLSIDRSAVLEYLTQLYKRNLPVLCETPPAKSIEESILLWEMTKRTNAKIQIAEQYFLQPLYTAWKRIIDDGLIGEVHNINISSLHGYHAMSIIRLFLGIGFANCAIHGKRYTQQVVETNTRDGDCFDGKLITYKRDRAALEFENGRIAFFDFSDPAQYHSYIRTRQMTVQGNRGEIDDLYLRYLTKENVPVTSELKRIDKGIYNNQEWAHYGIMLGDKFLYKNPFPGARLNDDEIAVASCICGMKTYMLTGKGFYNLNDALQDVYLSLKLEEALSAPFKEIRTQTQAWSEEF